MVSNLNVVCYLNSMPIMSELALFYAQECTIIRSAIFTRSNVYWFCVKFAFSNCCLLFFDFMGYIYFQSDNFFVCLWCGDSNYVML